ncbi:MAG TPA: tRNA (adenosine(37)-N6)-threonylcarbamoyltransferase complex ATPase subunit type 1 TsaE [Bacteroidia bacterium]|jgi:tRNA threonylcarbamoyladenosine biosynthesis protein TsaE|nr:tRNA (adenosine(37)-N6)-threonylcarbamoyltransferase complex ATPase subunit type 1 TsaE [Bacteroidia bacterium]
MRLLCTVHKEEELERAAQVLLEVFKNTRVFIFSGALGSGKTTYIKYICKVLGVKTGISSPTFSLVNEYECADGSEVFHFDFYRIDDIQEAYDIGYEEYLYSGHYCFIEWPEKIEELIPKDAVEIKIEVKSNGIRELWVKKII